MLPNHLLQYVFHISTTTWDNTLQVCHKSSNDRVQDVRLYAWQLSANRIFQFRQIGWTGSIDRDIKYPHSQKSTGVRSGDRRSHENLQRLLIILSFPKVCIKNSLNVLAVWLVAPSCINITISSASFSRKHGTILSRKNFNNVEHLLLPFSIHLLDTVFQRKRVLR